MTVQASLPTRIELNRFQYRNYQLPIVNTLRSGKRRVVAVMPRRAGKDVMAFNYCIRAMLEKPGVYFYIFPTYSQGKKVLWDSLTNDGKPILDYLPQELIASKNSQEMKIKLINGSLFQVVGSDNYDSLMGTNPSGVVFSEYALQDPRAYQFIRPILTANQGWALFLSTPRGKNHLWELLEIAKHSDDWEAFHLTLNDTNHIPLREIEKERQEGIMNDDLIQQEYYCSFDLGVEGAYYAKYMDEMRRNGRISVVPWESAFQVHTAWDLGIRDSTCIIFFQVIGQTVRIIDYYEKDSEGLEHYATILDSKPYKYGRHIAPHDIKIREWTSGFTRFEKARQLGIDFTLATDLQVADGIESVKSLFQKLWIDEHKCAKLIKSLENYRREYDAKRKVYKNYPLHDWASHGADAMRYLAISLPKTRDSKSAEELDKIWRESQLGNQANIPEIFRDSNTMQPYEWFK